MKDGLVGGVTRDGFPWAAVEGHGGLRISEGWDD